MYLEWYEELVGERLCCTALGEHYLLSVKLRVSSFSDHFKELLLCLLVLSTSVQHALSLHTRLYLVLISGKLKFVQYQLLWNALCSTMHLGIYCGRNYKCIIWIAPSNWKINFDYSILIIAIRFTFRIENGFWNFYIFVEGDFWSQHTVRRFLFWFLLAL